MGHGREKPGAETLLKSGFIIDGTGAGGYQGSLLIKDGVIYRISAGTVRAAATVIECAGKVIAPGFIDVHSHLDWRLPLRGHEDQKWPFIAQGITTLVTGNCGMSAAGFREGTAYRGYVENHILKSQPLKLEWDTVADLFSRLSSMGTSHNMAILAGHGSVRASLRGFDPSPLHPYECSEMIRILEKAMDQGARGVSLGLQYEPGMFAPAEEIKEVALAVKRRKKVLAVHLRALSALSTAYPIRPFGKPHNLMALSEMLDCARKTGVRLQVSHLIFVGSRSWRTADRALAMIEEAAALGADVRFDTYPYHCGASHINVLLPPWFLARGPAAYEDPATLKRLRRELALIRRVLGFGASEVQITDARVPELKKYDGLFLSEIARQRRQKTEDALIDLARESGGHAAVLCHRYSTPSIVESLIRHPLSLFMTDAWVEPSGAQNPSAFGAFPRFLRLAREKKLLSLEEAVHKMTGAAADRFGLSGRGVLAEGAPADVVVFDPETVGDAEEPGGAPAGIEYVFINGKKVLSGGKKDPPLNSGVPL